MPRYAIAMIVEVEADDAEAALDHAVHIRLEDGSETFAMFGQEATPIPAGYVHAWADAYDHDASEGVYVYASPPAPTIELEA